MRRDERKKRIGESKKRWRIGDGENEVGKGDVKKIERIEKIIVYWKECLGIEGVKKDLMEEIWRNGGKRSEKWEKKKKGNFSDNEFDKRSKVKKKGEDF